MSLNHTEGIRDAVQAARTFEDRVSVNDIISQQLKADNNDNGNSQKEAIYFNMNRHNQQLSNGEYATGKNKNDT